MESVSRVAYAIASPERERVSPFRLVDVRGTYELAPSLDCIIAVQCESEHRRSRSMQGLQAKIRQPFEMGLAEELAYQARKVETTFRAASQSAQDNTRRRGKSSYTFVLIVELDQGTNQPTRFQMRGRELAASASFKVQKMRLVRTICSFSK